MHLSLAFDSYEGSEAREHWTKPTKEGRRLYVGGLSDICDQRSSTRKCGSYSMVTVFRQSANESYQLTETWRSRVPVNATVSWIYRPQPKQRTRWPPSMVHRRHTADCTDFTSHMINKIEKSAASSLDLAESGTWIAIGGRGPDVISTWVK